MRPLTVLAAVAAVAFGGAGGVTLVTASDSCACRGIDSQIAPTVSGLTTQGQTLTANVGTWTSTPAGGYTYQWFDCDANARNCQPAITGSAAPVNLSPPIIDIVPPPSSGNTGAGAVSQTYTLGVGDVGHTLLVRVTASNDVGQSTSADSSPTAVVVASGAPSPVNTVAPAMSGSTTIGSTLTINNPPGTWSGSPTSFTYQWQDCDQGSNCAAILGATSSSYILTNTDVNHTVRVLVTATNASGTGIAASNQSPVTGGSNFTQLLGTPTIGANTTNLAADTKNASLFAAQQNGNVTRCTTYLKPGPASGSQAIRCVIYTDRNGTPGQLLATSNEISVTNAITAGWYDLPIPGPLTVAQGASYWVGVLSGPAANASAFVFNGGAGQTNADIYSGGPSNPFGSSAIGPQQMSLFATLQ